MHVILMHIFYSQGCFSKLVISLKGLQQFELWKGKGLKKDQKPDT